MAYSKTTWKDNQAPYLNANNLNKIETGIDTNDAQIVENTAQLEQNTTDIANNRTDIDINSDNILGLSVGEVYQGTWTPEAGTEYPASPEGGWSYYIQFLDDDGYEFVGGDLAGRIANNSDKIIYNGTTWSMIDNTNEQLGYYLVDDVSSMLSLSPLQGALCETYGYYTANDGGGGSFNYDSALSGTNNGGTILNGWVRQYSTAVDPLWFGAKDARVAGNENFDSTTFLQDACDYCDSVSVPIDFSSYKFNTSGTLTMTAELVVRGSGRGSLGRLTTSTKDFIAVLISEGNGTDKRFGVIDDYLEGIVIRSSVSRVTFETISNCDSGLIIDANSGNNLNNIVSGTQIGYATNAVTFRQNGTRVQQGNEVFVNFISNSLHSLVFDDNGTHGSASNWDGNYVEFKASDPYYQTGATLFYNKSSYAVQALTYKIDSWAGGWNIGDNTMEILKGKLTASLLEFSFATGIDSSMFDSENYSSNIINLLRAPLSSPTISASNTIGLANFNGGVELFRQKQHIRITTPTAIGIGQTQSSFVYHALSMGTANNLMFSASAEGLAGADFLVNATCSTNEEVGLVRINYTNVSNTTISIDTQFNIILDCSD